MRHSIALVLVIMGLLRVDGRLARAQAPAVESPLQHVTRLHQQVVQLYRQGQYEPAITLARRPTTWPASISAWSIRRWLRPSTISDCCTKPRAHYAAAEPLLQQALEMRRRTTGEDSPDFVTSLNNLAGLYSALGRYSEAEQQYQRALDIVRAAVGEDNEYFAGALTNLASLYKAMGHYTAAEPLYQRALRVWRAQMGAPHPDTAVIVHNLADLYFRLGQYSSAEPLYQQALEFTRTTLGADHPQYARSLQSLAVLLRSYGTL